jgi:hypothetical protein
MKRFAAGRLQFAVLDLIAEVHFVTASSIRFSLGKWDDGSGPAEEQRGGILTKSALLMFITHVMSTSKRNSWRSSLRGTTTRTECANLC